MSRKLGAPHRSGEGFRKRLAKQLLQPPGVLLPGGKSHVNLTIWPMDCRKGHAGLAYIPIVLKFEYWSESDRAMWDAMFAGRDLFDGTGPWHQSSAGSRAFYMQGYDQWLSFLSHRYPDELTHGLIDRISRERLRAYIEECEVRLAPTSIANPVGSIDLIARMAGPGLDWSQLRRAFYRLGARARNAGLPPPEPITGSEIFRWSFERLAEVTLEPPTKRRAIHFRQALMIGFLISRPIRRRALLAMRVDKHVTADPDGYRLNSGAEDMTDKQARSFLLPRDVVPHMKAYLQIYRPLLARGKEYGRLLAKPIQRPAD